MVEKNDRTHVTFWIPNEDLERFDRIAKEKRMSRAAVLRGCVLDTIKKNKELLCKE